MVQNGACRVLACAAMLTLLALSCQTALAADVMPGDTVKLEIPFTEASYVGGSASVSNNAVLCDVSAFVSGEFTGTAGGESLSVTYENDVDGSIIVTARVREDAPAGADCTLSFYGSVKAELYDARYVSGELNVSVPVPEPVKSAGTKVQKPQASAQPPKSDPPAEVIPEQPAEQPPEPTEMSAKGNPSEPSGEEPLTEPVASGELAAPSEPEPDAPEAPAEPEEHKTQPDVPESPEEEDPDGLPTNRGINLAVPFVIALVIAALIAGGVVGVSYGVKRRREERETDYTPLVEYDISEDA